MTTNILLTLIVVLLVVWIVWLIRHKRNNPPKYQLGDRVRFAYGIVGITYVHVGKIWKIRKYWLCEPSYNIYYSFRDGTGSSYDVSESDIIELIERTNGTPSNPLEPKKI